MATIKEQVYDLVADHLGVAKDTLTDETHFKKDLGIDSLDSVEMVMELEEEFDVKIEDDESEKLLTVGDVVKLMEKKQSSG
jgi:acyl carrier protein